MSVPANSLVEEDINVFWDFETTRGVGLSSSVSTYDLVKNLRAALRPYGKLKSVRAYWDFSGQLLASAASARSDLSSSGVTLIDCPASGRKDLATKMMLVDIFIHALDHSPPHTFAIITGDRDLAYGISTLRLRDYRVIVISPSGIPELSAQASVQIDWTSSILGVSNTSNVLASSTIPFTAPSQTTTAAFALPTLTSGFVPQRTKAASDATQTYAAPTKSEDLHQLSGAPEIGRGRQGSMFSRPAETGDSYSMYGDIGNLFATPPTKSRPAPFGNVGDSNMFSGARSNSRGPAPSRGDSAGFGFTRQLGTSPQVPAPAFWGTSTPSLKSSKKREFPVAELEDILPPSRSLAFDLPTHGSNFAPFDESHPWEPRKDKGKAKATSLDDTMLPKTESSSTSSSSSRGSSTFSFVEKPVTSTARTSLVEPNNDADSKLVSMPSPKPMEIEREPTPLIPDVPVTHSPEFAEVKSVEERPPAPVKKTLQATAKPFIPPVPYVLPSSTPPASSSILPQSKPVETPEATPTIPSASAPASVSAPAVGTPAIASEGSAGTGARVPTEFIILIDVLRQMGGRTTKSSLGAALLKANHRVYQLAGVAKFGHYISAAIDAKIIQEVNSKESIALRPEYR